MNKSQPIREFPLEEFKAELDRDHAEFVASVQESLTKFTDQNPKLMDSKIKTINDVKIFSVLGSSPPKGVWLKHLQQEQSRVEKELCSQIESQMGRPVPLDEVDEVLTLPSEATRLDLTFDNTKTMKEIKHIFLMRVNKSIPETQAIRPDIQIGIYLPDRWGAQLLIYIESKGKVLVDHIIKPPTVTLDTNVVREWWDNRERVEHVNRLLGLGKRFKIDLAVTGRICDDIPSSPLAEKINELPNLNIHNIGSVIRFGHWNAGNDVAGNDEFKKFLDSPVIAEKLDKMNKKKPDWRDWDHLHTHYIYKRDYFLTWDKGILHFAVELKKELGITVMKPDTFMI